ncbi:hypothetical protein N8Z70_03150 [Candidatus Puniceispirillum sp.]|nr:hypothetical protein [Alphaproteobacteria bacterium]MDC1294020.1 hypothetical protein [Candidatus Puniceispirillum sp.]
MGQQVSVTKLKEQIEVAKRGLAEMSPAITAADHSFQSVAMPATNFAGLAVGHEDDGLYALDQKLVANDDMATHDMGASDDFQFFHRPKRSDPPFLPLPPISVANAVISDRDDDQPLFQALDQRLDRLEDEIAQSQKHILELITLLSGLDMEAKPARRNSTSVKYLLRRNLYWLLIGLLVLGWVALTPSGHYWISHFMGLV